MGSPQLTLTPEQAQQFAELTSKLGLDQQTALDKVLDIADYIVKTDEDPNSKLLVEQDGKFTQLRLRK